MEGLSKVERRSLSTRKRELGINGGAGFSVFTPQGWAQKATNSLLRCSTAVDHACHVVVAAKKVYAMGPIAEDIRQVALTIAVLERSLFAYADRIRLHTLAVKKQRGTVAAAGPQEVAMNSQSAHVTPFCSQGENAARNNSSFSITNPDGQTASSSGSSVHGINEEEKLSSESILPLLLHDRVEALKPKTVATDDVTINKLPLQSTHSPSNSQTPSVHPWKHSGGLVMLLDMLSRNLAHLRSALHQLIRASSLRAYYLQDRWRVPALAFGWAFVFRGFDHSLKSGRLKRLFSFTSLVQLIRFAPSLFGAFLSLSVPASAMFIHGWAQSVARFRLRRLHDELLILFRSWLMCVSILDYGEADNSCQHLNVSTNINSRAKSFRRRRRGPHRVSSQSIQEMPISRWMLDLVPSSLGSCIWYKSNTRMAFFIHSMNTLYASVGAWHRWTGVGGILTLPIALGATAFYAVSPDRAADRATAVLSSPDLVLIRHCWQVLEMIAHHGLLSVRTRRLLSRLSTFVHLDPSWFNALDMKRFLIKSIGISVTPPLASATFNIGAGQQTLVVMSTKRLTFQSNIRDKPSGGGVIFCIHGGNWAAGFAPIDCSHLCDWALRTEAVVVSLDLSHDTVGSFVEAVDRASSIYRWIVAGGLGFVPRRIVLFGDGSGGTVAVGVALKTSFAGLSYEHDQLVEPESESVASGPNSSTDEAVDEIADETVQAVKLVHQRRADALVLAYPSLDLRQRTPTTSKALFMMDPVVPLNLLHQCRTVYVPGSASTSRAEINGHDSPIYVELNEIESLMSPLCAPDALLRRLPPVSIMVGGIDPFLDDSVDFCHRLAALGKGCQLRVFPQLPHAFLSLSMLLPRSVVASQLACEWMQNALQPPASSLESAM